MTRPVGVTNAANSAGEPQAIRFELLGGFRVSVASRIVERTEWRLRKAGILVKLLALAREHTLHREQAMDLLWPDLDAKSAANNLHRALHFARRVLDPSPEVSASQYLVFEGDLLTLCPGGSIWVDVDAFESTAASARRSRETSAYRAALDLYTGELLPEDRYEPWAEERRRELQTVYLAMLIELGTIYEKQEEFGAAIETIQKVVANEPTHEEAHSGLMRMYALSGRRQEALLQYQRLQAALSEELDTEPGPHCKMLYEEILSGQFPKAVSAWAKGVTSQPERHPVDMHNLPHLRSSFVGRQQEMLEVKRSLAMTDLLTITGAGGCGKTRLALEVAHDLVGAYPDGVRLVKLASLSDPLLVPQAVAAVLGVSEQPGRSTAEALSDHLRSRQMLLVLDNCEHLIDACAQIVDTLLESCKDLRILATSREPLGVAGESIWSVLPLAAPSANELPSVDELVHYEAIKLFVDRARSKLPTFSLNSQNARAVARICSSLEGMPLAIELAAARVTALAVGEIAARFENSLDLLSSGSRTADHRHRTLRATLEWSYRLLSERERTLFGRLSVFTGGWTLEAAEAVGGADEHDVLELLSRLVEKSLVVADVEADGEQRYRMLEPIRQYGRECLEASGETEQVQERHAKYYLALVEAEIPELMGSRPVACLERLEVEFDNLRAALGWFLDESAESKEHTEMGLRLATSLGRFWNTYGPEEGRRWLERGLSRLHAARTSLRSQALGEAGFIAIFQNDPHAMALLEEGLALSRESEDESGLAYSVSSLGHAVAHAGDHDRLATLCDEAELLLGKPLDLRAKAHLLLFLGVAAMSQGNPTLVSVHISESLDLFRELEDIRHVAMSLGVAGISALDEGDFERAAELFEEDMQLLRELRDKAGIVYGLLGMAGVSALRGHPARASKLWGASEVLRETFGLPLTSMVRDHYDHDGLLATARAGLDKAAFDAAWAEGRAMSPEQAIEYALGTTDEPKSTADPETRQQTPDGESPDVLTRRQREVALLVAQGLTNRQVASELSISEHTVATHVREILKSLGFSTRTQLADWAVGQDASVPR